MPTPTPSIHTIFPLHEAMFYFMHSIHRRVVDCGGWFLKCQGSVPHFKKHVDFVKIGPGPPQSHRINPSTLQLVVYKF